MVNQKVGNNSFLSFDGWYLFFLSLDRASAPLLTPAGTAPLLTPAGRVFSKPLTPDWSGFGTLG